MDCGLGILFVLGVGVLGGTLGAWIFQRMRIPQVVGYIAMGVLIGESGFRVVTAHDVQVLRPFNLFALGVIGFLVGGELHFSMFKKYGRQFTAILLGEGLLAFLLVGLPSTLVLYALTHNFASALAGGVVFGAIASATDPASTIDVLWEYRSAGVLSTAIIAIVALDDALAMTLYGLGTSTAQILTSQGGSVLKELGHTAVELFGAVGLGVAAGFGLNFIIRRLPHTDKTLGILIGTILLSISISVIAGLDVILATMSIGIVLANVAPRRSKELFSVIRSFSAPIYILFFVFVGARLGIRNMPGWIWGLVVLYVVGRSLGKMTGSWIGGKLSGAEQPVRKYLGMAIFAQGGVAVGLSIMASQHLQGIMITEGMSLGDAIIFTVTATTLIVQVGGPPFTKLAVKLAGELGRNVTEEDVIGSLTVSDVMDAEVQPLSVAAPLREAVELFSRSEALAYPVIARDGTVAGVVGFDALKESLSDRESWNWLLVSDIMQPLEEKVLPEQSLKEVLEDMSRMQIETLPVVEDGGQLRPVGVLDMRHARRRIREELMRRQAGAAA